MDRKPTVLVISLACVGLLSEALILAITVLPLSGPGADATISRSAFVLQASLVAVLFSAGAAIIAVARRKTVGRGVLMFGLTPGFVVVLAVATTIVLDLRGSATGAFRHDLRVEVRRSSVQSEPVRILTIRLVGDSGYSGSGYDDDDGLLEDEIIAESFSAQRPGVRTFEIELEDEVCEFVVMVPDQLGTSPWTDWLVPQSVWRKLPSGRRVPAETEDHPVEIRFRFSASSATHGRSAT